MVKPMKNIKYKTKSGSLHVTSSNIKDILDKLESGILIDSYSHRSFLIGRYTDRNYVVIYLKDTLPTLKIDIPRKEIRLTKIDETCSLIDITVFVDTIREQFKPNNNKVNYHNFKLWLPASLKST